MDLLIKDAYAAGYTIHKKYEAIVITPLFFRQSKTSINNLDPRDGIEETWSACIDQTGDTTYILAKGPTTILNGVDLETVKAYLIEHLTKGE